MSKKLKKWLAEKIFKKELENANKLLKVIVAEQHEEIQNLKLRLTQIYNQGENKWK